MDKQARDDLAAFAAARGLSKREMRDRLACVALYTFRRLERSGGRVLVDDISMTAALMGKSFAEATRFAVDLAEQALYADAN